MPLTDDERQPPRSLLDGVQALACSAFGIASLRHRSALRGLTSDGSAPLIPSMMRKISDNYAQSGASANKDRSRQNWRWCSLQPQISAANVSPEAVLERAVASACERQGQKDWANQVPVASGLVAGAADGRRAIDLVHRHRDGHFEFIELKIASDTPLYAAVEVIGYASLWLIARADPPAHPSELLTADVLDLRVLAPEKYYDGFDLQWLEARLNEEVSSLGWTHGVRLSFAFDVLPAILCVSPTSLGDGDLMQALASRAPLFDKDGAQ